MNQVWHALGLAVETAVWFVAVGAVTVGVIYGMLTFRAWRRIPR